MGTEFILKRLPSLKTIVVEDECFLKTRTFEIEGLEELESIVIGSWSFTNVYNYNEIVDSQRTDGNYTISNCPKLKSIRIGDVSFGDYHFFVMTNLPSIESIDIGKYSFYHAQFGLTSLTRGYMLIL